MTTVFADSFFFFALNNSRDSRHREAVEFVSSHTGRIWTTSQVLMELGDGLCHPDNRDSFLLTVRLLRENPSVTIEPSTDELLDAGMELFSKRMDKHWSLTDCISFVVMERESIREALTGDHHFEQAGFIALLK